MPLKAGSSRKVIGENISEEMKTKPRAQAIAIGLNKARESVKKRGGKLSGYLRGPKEHKKRAAENHAGAALNRERAAAEAKSPMEAAMHHEAAASHHLTAAMLGKPSSGES